MDVGGRALPGANAEEARSNTIAPTNFIDGKAPQEVALNLI